jgi:hypothetical protein
MRLAIVRKKLIQSIEERLQALNQFFAPQLVVRAQSLPLIKTRVSSEMNSINYWKH